MMGLSGTEREKSLLTRIFSPPAGIFMCWYAMNAPGQGGSAEKGCDYTSWRAHLCCVYLTDLIAVLGFPSELRQPTGRARVVGGGSADRRSFHNHSREGDPQ